MKLSFTAILLVASAILGAGGLVLSQYVEDPQIMEHMCQLDHATRNEYSRKISGTNLPVYSFQRLNIYPAWSGLVGYGVVAVYIFCAFEQTKAFTVFEFD